MICGCFILNNFRFVLDGGALLHRIPWAKDNTYSIIAEKYLKYVIKHYGINVTIVFDGYSESGSTKDMTHLRRARLVGQEVFFTSEMKFTTKKEVFFLLCKSNKSRFIKFLANYLEENNLTTIQAKGDADLLIVQTAVEQSYNSKIKLIGEDTDLLVLLIHHVSRHSHQIILINEGRSGKPGKCWDIQKIQNQFGSRVCDHILFAHGILGCDTTSRLHGIGKGLVIKRLLNTQDECLSATSKIFLTKGASKVEVAAAKKQ